MESLNLNLLTPKKKLLVDQKVSEIRVAAYKGELTILPGHAALITTLSSGILTYKTADNKTQKAHLSWGYLEVLDNDVNILAEEVRKSDQDDERVNIDFGKLKN